MTDLWLVLTPILLADVLNPVLFAYLVYLAGGERGVLHSTAALAGHTAAYFGWGVVIAFSFDQVTEFMANPGPISYGLQLLLGLLLLWLAWKSRQPASAAEPSEQPPASPGSAFVTGAIINFIGMPFAVPYFAAIGQILKTDLTISGALTVLTAYNLLYMLPFLLVPVLTLVMGKASQALLGRINQAIERGADAIMPLVLALIGIGLSADSVWFFATGTSLF